MNQKSLLDAELRVDIAMCMERITSVVRRYKMLHPYGVVFDEHRSQDMFLVEVPHIRTRTNANETSQFLSWNDEKSSGFTRAKLRKTLNQCIESLDSD